MADSPDRTYASPEAALAFATADASTALEREACAHIADLVACENSPVDPRLQAYELGAMHAAEKIAAKIRGRR